MTDPADLVGRVSRTLAAIDAWLATGSDLTTGMPELPKKRGKK